jgi:hypothetical protein
LTGIQAIKAEETAFLYPNPSAGDFTVQFSKDNVPSEILIYDQAGKIISQYFPLSHEINFSFGKSLAPGIYFVRLKNDRNLSVLKAVKLK